MIVTQDPIFTVQQYILCINTCINMILSVYILIYVYVYILIYLYNCLNERLEGPSSIGSLIALNLFIDSLLIKLPAV